MLVVVMGLRSLQLLRVGCPIDEKGFVAFGVILNVSRDLLDGLGLKGLLSLRTKLARNSLNRLASLAFASNLTGHRQIYSCAF